MSDVHCLGGQLEQDGYTLSYMNGADAKKYSKRSFLTEHGYIRIFDFYSIDSGALQDRENEWGMSDEVLYEHIRKEIEYLEMQEDPYVLSYLTISTHGPDAYLDHNCSSDSDIKIPDAIRCSLEQFVALYDDLQAKGYLEDTVVVVMSDHLARGTSLGDQLRAAEGRSNLFFVLNGPEAGEVERVSTPLDIYPTLLEILGYTIRDGRANFGVSLNSDTPNLVEHFAGPRQVSARFRLNHALGASSGPANASHTRVN